MGRTRRLEEVELDQAQRLRTLNMTQATRSRHEKRCEQQAEACKRYGMCMRTLLRGAAAW